MNFLKIVKFDFVNIIRNPMLLVVNTILPIILIGLIGFITKESYGSDGISSYDYYGVTMIIFTALAICLTATNTFMEESVRKGNTRIIYAPVSKTKIYLSKLISTYFLGTISYNTILLVGQFILHINFGGRNILYIMLLINLLALFGSCLGTLFCCIFKNEEVASSTVQIPVMIFTFLGGIFFPTNSLGRTFESISYLSPIKWITECIFKIIYDNDFSLYSLSIIFIIIGSAICIGIIQIIFKPEEYV